MFFFHVHNGSLLKKSHFKQHVSLPTEYELYAHLVCLDMEHIEYAFNAFCLLFLNTLPTLTRTFGAEAYRSK